jgi:hypothetical protein
VGSKEVKRKFYLLTQKNVRFLMQIYICLLLEVIEDSLSHLSVFSDSSLIFGGFERSEKEILSAHLEKRKFLMKIYICEIVALIEDSLSHLQYFLIAHLFLVGSKEMKRKFFLLT